MLNDVYHGLTAKVSIILVHATDQCMAHYVEVFTIYYLGSSFRCGGIKF